MKNPLSSLWFDESGSSAVELALISATILVLLFLGASETGWRIWTKLQLDNAVRVGIEYVLIHGDSNSTDMLTAARSATLLDTEVTISPTNGSSYSYCGCASSSGVMSQTCGGTCSDGSRAGTYAGITASIARVPLFHGCHGLVPQAICPSSGEATVLSSTAVSRIQ
jgi:Flp pilus assembly protein TadG